jgi:hypothetical protein
MWRLLSSAISQETMVFVTKHSRAGGVHCVRLLQRAPANRIVLYSPEALPEALPANEKHLRLKPANLVALLQQQLFVYRNLFQWLTQPFQAPPALKGIHDDQMSLAFGG